MISKINQPQPELIALTQPCHPAIIGISADCTIAYDIVTVLAITAESRCVTTIV